MCTPTNNFLLCTCTRDATTDFETNSNSWTLSRDNTGAPNPDSYANTDIVGKFLEPLPHYFSDEEIEYRIKKLHELEAELNARNCFDFKYQPYAGDVLKIHLNEREFSFVFRSGGHHYINGFEYTGSWSFERCGPEDDRLFSMRAGKVVIKK